MLKYSYLNKMGGVFDILKFTLAMMIVMMHSGLIPRLFLPIFRLAVPLFFILTAYLFFVKINESTKEKEKNNRLRKFVSRNLSLYLFWSIVMSPFVVATHLGWFNQGLDHALFEIVKNIILGFFPASWFILASAVAVPLVYILSRRFSNIILIFIAIIFYVPCLLTSNYAGLFFDTASITDFNSNVFRVFFTFPVAMIWVTIGKILSEKPITIRRSCLCALILVSLCVYAMEWLLIERLSWSASSDVFLTSIPLCTLLFVVIGQWNSKCMFTAKTLRYASIIIYCTHQSFISVLGPIIYHYIGKSIPILVYLLTLLFCFLICFIVIKGSKRISLLKYAF